MTVEVDHIEYVNGEQEEVRGYMQRQIKEGCVTYSWSDTTFIIPLHNIKHITTSEE